MLSFEQKHNFTNKWFDNGFFFYSYIFISLSPALYYLYIYNVLLYKLLDHVITLVVEDYWSHDAVVLASIKKWQDISNS